MQVRQPAVARRRGENFGEWGKNDLIDGNIHLQFLLKPTSKENYRERAGEAGNGHLM